MRERYATRPPLWLSGNPAFSCVPGSSGLGVFFEIPPTKFAWQAHLALMFFPELLWLSLEINFEQS